MKRFGSCGLLLLVALLGTGCVSQSTSESGRAASDPNQNPSQNPTPNLTLAHLQELLARPGALKLPSYMAANFVNYDEGIPDSALSVEVKIVDFSADAEGGVEGYFRKRVAEEVDNLRVEEEDVGELLFLATRSDFDMTLQKGDEAAQVLLSRIDPSVQAEVTQILDEGASYFRFMTNDYAAEMSASDLLVIQPSTDDAGNKALEIAVGCCGGY